MRKIKNIYDNELLFEKFKVEELLKPKNDSIVKMNMYWICIDGYVFRSKTTLAWQCNGNEVIVKHLADSYGVEYKLFPVLYVHA